MFLAFFSLVDVIWAFLSLDSLRLLVYPVLQRVGVEKGKKKE